MAAHKSRTRSETHAEVFYKGGDRRIPCVGPKEVFVKGGDR